MNTNINKNHNLQSKCVKNKILRYLLSSDIQTNTKIYPITNDQDITQIRIDEYIVCPRVYGTRSWIIFFHTNNDYYAVTFSKNNLHNVDTIKIYPININVRKTFYIGTIMEGIYHVVNGKKNLIIDEVYILSGENQLLKSKTDRLMYLSNYLNRSINVSPNFGIGITPFYSTDGKSLKNLYEKIKQDITIKEIIFYPNNYGKKIFSYTITNLDLIDNVVRISLFILQKTGKPDVYNLLSPDNNNKIDIAYIPSIDTSKMCKKWFKKKNKELLVKCKLDNDNNKWIPIEIENELPLS